LVIHTREAEADTFQILKDMVPSEYPIHVHCFTYSKEFAERLLANWSRLFIGFTGVITFPSAQKDLVHKLLDTNLVPLERILLETDGPFMAPVPMRGKVCHSGYIPYIAEFLADRKGVTVSEVYRITTQNAKNVFGLVL